MEAVARGGYTFYSQILTLTTQCPAAIDFPLVGTLRSYLSSYIGAIGTAAQFDFAGYISALPKCSNILEYQLVE